MKIGAGIAGILLGIFCLLYVGVFGGLLGAGAGWLGSIGSGNSTITNWASVVSLISWLAPLLAIIGGIVTFSNPRAGGVMLAASACLLWYLLGLGTIGALFVFPIGATAVLAFFAARSTAQVLPSVAAPAARATWGQNESASQTPSPEFDRAKWNALVQYDNDIAAVAERLQPLGQKWLDEFASSYLALNDKQYLRSIEQKIAAAERAETAELQRRLQRAAEIEKRRAEEYRRLGEMWGHRLWGNKRNKLRTIAACVLILASATAPHLYHYLTAPPPRPTDRIVWSGYTDKNCFNIECLRGQMQKFGANREAIQFAERLSAFGFNVLGASAGAGATARYANGIYHFGHMDIVTYVGPNETRGLVFVDRDLGIIDPNVTDFVATLRGFSAFTARHPRAFVISGPQVVRTTELPNGISFLLQYPVANCMACEPLAALEVPWDFTKAGRGGGGLPVILRPWSQRLPAVAL